MKRRLRRLELIVTRQFLTFLQILINHILGPNRCKQDPHTMSNLLLGRKFSLHYLKDAVQQQQMHRSYNLPCKFLEEFRKILEVCRSNNTPMIFIFGVQVGIFFKKICLFFKNLF